MAKKNDDNARFWTLRLSARLTAWILGSSQRRFAPAPPEDDEGVVSSNQVELGIKLSHEPTKP
ncbi:hypothetical protein MESS4_820045 [Mesorhizobium sp. STM 4661]|nr:hypothetical protein MESS4_820045 [Mesorhizobium sp. STM 4661]